MSSLLVVHHCSSPALEGLVNAVKTGTTQSGLEDVELKVTPALGTGVSDVLDADGYVLVTPANFGYMSGAMKHFFDVIYYPCLGSVTHRPYALVVHGNNDTAGAVTSVERIVSGLEWEKVASAVEVTSPINGSDLEQVSELSAVVAASTLS